MAKSGVGVVVLWPEVLCADIAHSQFVVLVGLSASQPLIVLPMLLDLAQISPSSVLWRRMMMSSQVDEVMVPRRGWTRTRVLYLLMATRCVARNPGGMRRPPRSVRRALLEFATVRWTL